MPPRAQTSEPPRPRRTASPAGAEPAIGAIWQRAEQAGIGVAFSHPCLDDAVQRAKTLERKHHDDGSPVGANPSTSLWRLTELLRTSPERIGGR